MQLFPTNPLSSLPTTATPSALEGNFHLGSVAPTSEKQDASVVKTIRVLHIINGEFFAGAERVQMHLGRCLPSYGVQADFVALKSGRFADQFDLSESKLFLAPMRHRFDLRVTQRILAMIADQQYDLLHAHTPRSAMITSRLSKQLGVPWVYHLHSPAARDSSHRWRNRLNCWIERCSLRTVSELVAVSNSLRGQAIADGWPAERITVVHNGVPAVCPARELSPVAGKTWTLGMVALMRPRKGLEVALESLAILRDRGIVVNLKFIGPFECDSYQHAIQALIQSHALQSQVEFVGFTKDVPQALTTVDALLLPSLYGEGLPMVVLEAMAAGVPVVATRVEGTPEAIRHGIDGLLAEPQNAVSLSEPIAALVNGQYHWAAMSSAARQRHAALFSDQAMAAKLADVYRKVVPSPPSATRT